MFELLYSGQTEPGANGEADRLAIGQAPRTLETPHRYGDVPLGVEAAWPPGTELIASA